MSKRKNFLIIILLSLLTLIIVITPFFINEINRSLRLGRTEKWNFNGAAIRRLTDWQAARMYCSGGESYRMGDMGERTLEEEEVRRDVLSVIEKVHQSENPYDKYMLALFSDGKMDYVEESVLTLLEGSPTVLHIVYADFYDGGNHGRVVYEKKTMALFSFGYAEEKEWGDESAAKEINEFTKILADELAGYFEDTLRIEKGGYVIGCDGGEKNFVLGDLVGGFRSKAEIDEAEIDMGFGEY